MKKLTACFLVMVCVIMGGSVLAAGTEQCARAIERITAEQDRGNGPIAKLLVDFAIADCAPLGCSDEQREQLLELRKRIYLSCIFDQITFARETVAKKHDGLGALRILIRVNQMADLLETQLYGLDELYAVAFYAAANQNIEMARLAEEEGEFELAFELRMQAADFMRYAVVLDPRVKKLIPQKTTR